MSAVLENIENLPFSLDGGVCHRAAIGLIVLATDQTIEHEWRQMLRVDGVGLYESRLYNSASITPETLAEMEKDIKGATALISPGPMDVIAFGCTSGAMVIGEERVFERIREARPDVACTTPITAALAGLNALGAKRIALLTPYVRSINEWMRDYIEERGVTVPVMGSFNHENDNEVARIDSDSITRAILTVGASDNVDAVFVSCTSLRVAHLAESLEARLGKPVLSSNHAMAWHSLRLAGIREPILGWGRLFRN
jgi:maleate isomerase